MAAAPPPGAAPAAAARPARARGRASTPAVRFVLSSRAGRSSTPSSARRSILQRKGDPTERARHRPHHPAGDGAAPHHLPRIPASPRRPTAAGRSAARARHGGLPRRDRRRAHREALPRGHDPVPPAPRRHGREQDGQAAEPAPGDARLRAAGSRAEGRRFLRRLAANIDVGALLRRRQDRARRRSRSSPRNRGTGWAWCAGSAPTRSSSCWPRCPTPRAPPHERQLHRARAGPATSARAILAFAERELPPRAKHDLLLRDLRGAEGHRRPRRGAPGRRRRQARQGRRRHAGHPLAADPRSC